VSLRVARLSPSARLPTRAHPSDAALDLYADEDVELGPGERASVGTGLAVGLEEGQAALVLPRSGLALRHGLTLVNAPGLIDPGYRGEVQVLLLNTDPVTSCRLAVGERIAQLLLVRFDAAEPEEVDELDATARGGGGFGSSGR
jgi:dUTP pyrophosphatase